MQARPEELSASGPRSWATSAASGWPTWRSTPSRSSTATSRAHLRRPLVGHRLRRGGLRTGATAAAAGHASRAAEGHPRRLHGLLSTCGSATREGRVIATAGPSAIRGRQPRWRTGLVPRPAASRPGVRGATWGAAPARRAGGHLRRRHPPGRRGRRSGGGRPGHPFDWQPQAAPWSTGPPDRRGGRRGSCRWTVGPGAGRLRPARGVVGGLQPRTRAVSMGSYADGARRRLRADARLRDLREGPWAGTAASSRAAVGVGSGRGADELGTRSRSTRLGLSTSTEARP